MPRAVEFDLEATRAIILREFWVRGYEATSLSHLEQATSLVRTSLYNSFGNKPEMFRQSLELYHATVEAQMAANIDKNGSEGLFDAIAAMMTGPDTTGQQPAGCLMVMTATQSKSIEPWHLELVRTYRAMLVRNAQEALERDKAAGRIVDQVEPKSAAEFLVCLLWGALAAQCLGQADNPASAGTLMLRQTLDGWRAR
ncbi:MAG: TetR/AcrR family transcriptional regulator [Pseudomonadota bacterium]